MLLRRYFGKRSATSECGWCRAGCRLCSTMYPLYRPHARLILPGERRLVRPNWASAALG